MVGVFHGPVIAVGIIGGIISLERAVALSRRWTWMAPLLFFLSGLSAVILGIQIVSAALALLASLFLSFIFLLLFKLKKEAHMVVMLVGSFVFLASHILWLLGYAISLLFLLWVVFLTLIIAGERMELSRIMFRRKSVKIMLVLFISIMLVSLTGMFYDIMFSEITFGFSILGVAVWLLRYDPSLLLGFKHNNLRRFMSVNLLLGYIWLAVFGLIRLLSRLLAGYVYDASIHSFFMGFVLSMIIAHSPLIVPSILQLPKITYKKTFYIATIILTISLATRIIGDIMLSELLRQAGGVGNVLAIIALLANVVMIQRG